MPSRLLATPFAIAGLIFLYLAWEVHEGYSWYIIPFVLTISLIFVFSPQIDWYWLKRNPPKLDPPIHHVLTTYHSFYQALPAADKTNFRNRVSLFMIGNDFKAQGAEAVPEDLKGAVAINAVHLTYGLEEFLFRKFETVVMYSHPFPSPQYPKHEHVSELYEEDGVILFAADQLMQGLLYPNKFYNIGLHEYAHAFILSNPDLPWPQPTEELWEKLEQISGFNKTHIFETINRPDVELLPAIIVHYFIFPEGFKVLLADFQTIFDDIFRPKVETN